MKRRRSTILPGSSRRKGSRRARYITDFLCTSVFNTAEHIVDFGIHCIKRMCLGISAAWKRRKKAGAGTRGAKPGVVVQEPANFRPLTKSQVRQVTFDSIVGLGYAKNQIRKRVILPIQHQRKADILKVNTKGGILLIGPPGNGKTSLAKALVHEVPGVALFHVMVKDIVRHQMGKSAQLIHELFETARKHRLAIIFLDDIDGIVRSREGTKSVIMGTTLNQFLEETDGLESDSSGNTLLLLGATNKPGIMDDAAKRTGRFDDRIFVGPPRLEERELLLKKSMNGIPASDDINYIELAGMTRLFSCSDIARGLVNEAKRRALDRSTRLKGKSEVSPVSMEDFLTVLQRIRPSVGEEDLRSKYGVNVDKLT